MQHRHAIILIAVCVLLLLIQVIASRRALAAKCRRSRDPFVPASMYYLNANNVWQVSGGPGTAEYMHLQMTAAANATTAPGGDLAFNTVTAASLGGYIDQPTPTTITLSPGATYKCTGCILGTAAAATYCWFNQSAAPASYIGTPAGPGDYAISYVACTQTTTISLRVVSGTTAITGTPTSTAGVVLYAWAIIELVNNSVSVAALSGSTPNSAGTGGYVPAPAAGQHRAFLRGDGTWGPAYQQLSQNPVAYGGALCGVAITTAGSGYTSPPTVIIAAPPPGGVQAIAIATLTNSAVSAITLINIGYGYTADPVVSVAPPPTGGVPAVAVAYAWVSGLESPPNCGNLLGNSSNNAYIRQDGTVWCVGDNGSGSPSPPPQTNANNIWPMVWAASTNPRPLVAKVWGSYYGRYVLGGNGYLYAAGHNEYGALGIGNQTNQPVELVQTLLPPGLVKFTCSNGYNGGNSTTDCMALLGNGQLYGWGYNAWGQLGLNNAMATPTPTRLVMNSGGTRPFIDSLYTVADIKMLSCGTGGTTSVILLTNGQVLLAGMNNRSQCANGNTANQNNFGWAMANQSLVNCSFGGGLSTAPPTYGLAGPATLTTTAAGVTTMRMPGTYTITLTMNNYNSGGTPTVNLLKNSITLASYTFPSTGNTYTLVNTPALLVGDIISITTTSVVTGSFNITGVAILSGITQIAGTGSDGSSSVAFLQGSTNIVFVSGNNDNAQWGTGTNGSANQYANPTAAIPSPIIAIYGAGCIISGGSVGYFAALTNAGLYAWGYNGTNFRNNSPDGNTYMTPQLYWPPANGTTGTIKKVLCTAVSGGDYTNSGNIAVLLTDGRIYFNGTNNNNVGGLINANNGTRTNGIWHQTALARRDVVDITMIADQSNQNMAILLSNGDVYHTGWSGSNRAGIIYSPVSLMLV